MVGEKRHYLFKIEDKCGKAYIGVTYCYEQDLESKLLQVVEQNGIDPSKYEALEFTDETVIMQI